MHRTILGLLLMAAAAPAFAMPYTLMIFEAPSELAKRQDSGPPGQDYWKAYARAGDALQAAGVMRGGAALQPSREIALDGRPLGGYFAIEVADAAAARRWADALPASSTGGKVVVVEGVPSPSMTASATTAQP